MENNIIKLVDYTNSKKDIQTINPFDIESIDLSKESITQKRIYSFMVDFAFIMVMNTAVHTSYSIFVNEFYAPISSTLKTQLMQTNSGLQVGVFMLLYMSYFFYSMYVLNGKTLGKMVFKLKTVSNDYIYEEDELESNLEIRQSFRRSFGYLTYFLSFGTFFIFSLLSEDKRGIPDYFSGTRTVSNEWYEAMKSYKQYDHEEVRININSLSKSA